MPRSRKGCFLHWQGHSMRGWWSRPGGSDGNSSVGAASRGRPAREGRLRYKASPVSLLVADGELPPNLVAGAGFEPATFRL